MSRRGRGFTTVDIVPELWAVVVGLAIGLGLAAFAIGLDRKRRRTPNPVVPGPDGRTAIAAVPSLESLRSDPASIESLRGAVASIYTMSLPIFTAGAETGNSVVRRRGLYIVDTTGAVHEPHGIVRASEIDPLASTLAKNLDVPWEHR